MPHRATSPADPVSQGSKPRWIDLLNPTPVETARVTAGYGVQVPSRESPQEIETSSRIRVVQTARVVASEPLD